MTLSSTISYGIVGDGRMARHFAHYLTLEGISFRQWSRQIAMRSKKSPSDALAGCSIILVLISDQAIDAWIEASPFLRGKKVVHFSGSWVSAHAVGMHPLMTFGLDLYDLETYRRMPFVVEEGTGFSDLFPDLTNPSFSIARDQKAYYHALCALSGNFTTLLWQKFFSELESRFKIPNAMAQKYMERVFANLAQDPKGALTGPLARGDADTVGAHLSALQGDPYRGVYEAFCRAYLGGI